MKWFERDGGVQLGLYREQIRANYPRLQWDICEGRVILAGKLALQSECGIVREVEIRVEFSDQHPREEPRVFDVASQFAHNAARHFYPDGRCCLWLPLESGWKPDDPLALLSFLHQTSVFFEKQFVFTVLKRWPGKQWGHNEMGYLEWICEKLEIKRDELVRFLPIWDRPNGWNATAPCLCGSGRKYRRCHRDSVDEVNRLLDVPDLLASLRRSRK